MPGAELPLSPYRVLDLTLEDGHLCGRTLADLGAEVIKIEPPAGDPSRFRGPFYENIPDPERSFTFWFQNLNKRGITLDINTVKGQQLLRRLAKSSDVIIESYPTGFMDSLGLGEEGLCLENSGLIVASISGFGRSGPHSGYHSPDIVVQAMGGLMYVTGDDDRPPLRIMPPQGYAHGAMEAAVGVMYALIHKGRTGQGQQVEASAQQAVLWSLMNATGMWDLNQVNVRREGALRGGVFGQPRKRLNWPCKDGFVTVTVVGSAAASTGNSTQNLVSWMIEEGFAQDFLAYYDFEAVDWADLAAEEYDLVIKPFHDFFNSKTKAELFEGALKRRIILYPVSTMTDHGRNMQLKDRKFFVKVAHPELGTEIIYPAPAVVFGGERLPVRRRPPLLGEHNREVYVQDLGISGDDLAEMAEESVI